MSEKNKTFPQWGTTALHWLWLLCFILLGSPMVVIEPIVKVAADEGASGDWALVFAMGYTIGLIPTVITGLIIVLIGLRRSMAGSGISAVIAFVVYAQTISFMMRHGALWLAICGMFGTLLFSIFLPGKKVTQDKSADLANHRGNAEEKDPPPV